MQNTDLDLHFNIHPIKKDLSLSTGTQAIIRSVKSLVLTNFYEVPFHPEIGSNIRALLFEPVSILTSNYIDKEIRNVIRNFEPRVKVLDVDITIPTDENSYIITITFNILYNVNPIVVDFVLYKLR